MRKFQIIKQNNKTKIVKTETMYSCISELNKFFMKHKIEAAEAKLNALKIMQAATAK